MDLQGTVRLEADSAPIHGVTLRQRQRLCMEKSVEWGMGRQKVGETAKSYRICMEFVWNLYGVCMEQHARNTQSTPSQRACNRRARRQAAQAGVVGSPTELAGTTPGGAEQLGAWRPGHYRGRGRVKRGKSQGGWMPMTDPRGCLRDCCPVWAGAGEGRLPRSRCRGQGSGIARCQPGRHRP